MEGATDGRLEATTKDAGIVGPVGDVGDAAEHADFRSHPPVCGKIANRIGRYLGRNVGWLRGRCVVQIRATLIKSPTSAIIIHNIA